MRMVVRIMAPSVSKMAALRLKYMASVRNFSYRGVVQLCEMKQLIWSASLDKLKVDSDPTLFSKMLPTPRSTWNTEVARLIAMSLNTKLLRKTGDKKSIDFVPVSHLDTAGLVLADLEELGVLADLEELPVVADLSVGTAAISVSTAVPRSPGIDRTFFIKPEGV